MRYNVLWTLKLDGKTYSPGDFVTLESAKAQELLAAGVIQREDKPFSKNKNHSMTIKTDK